MKVSSFLRKTYNAFTQPVDACSSSIFFGKINKIKNYYDLRITSQVRIDEADNTVQY